MAVLDRASLEESPLADLHTIARELGIDGFRRLRKAALVDVIVERQGGDADGAAPAAAAVAAGDEEEKPKRRTRTRTRRRKDADVDADVEPEVEAEAEPAKAEERAEEGATDEDAGDERPARRRSRTRDRSDRDRGDRDRGDRDRGDRDRTDRDRTDERGEPEVEKVAEGTVELLGNGSGFVRVSPPDPSDDDVYISAAQVRRCELVSGDRVTGPVRPPRRSERYPSLVRIDTINDRPADEVTEGTPFDELPAAFPTQRLALGGEDATLKAIEWLTPLGRGSRATIVGAPRAGKSEALKRLAGALSGQDGLEVSVVLAGVRPEEATEWKAGSPEPAAALSIAASPDAQANAIDRAIDTAKRIAARGGDAVVLIDNLSALPTGAARRALSAARDIVDGGSLTIIAVADQPVGGETTVIALDVTLASTGRFPALDLVASGTLRPELLVGEAGGDAIAQARAAALAERSR
jgi:transcription termination factor Rho